MPSNNVFAAARDALLACDPCAKAAAARRLQNDWLAGRCDVGSDACAVVSLPAPGRPPRPELVSPRAVARRHVATVEGRAALIHSLAHIEFNAINLALDAVYRFRGLPQDYYGDWLKVAAEEAYHFSRCARTCRHSATTTAASRRTTGCGRWRSRRRTIRWCAWRSSLACSRRVASMPRRR